VNEIGEAFRTKEVKLITVKLRMRKRERPPELDAWKRMTLGGILYPRHCEYYAMPKEHIGGRIRSCLMGLNFVPLDYCWFGANFRLNLVG
jgi:hypothetical protein